jgi:hypothetical protein
MARTVLYNLLYNGQWDSHISVCYFKMTNENSSYIQSVPVNFLETQTDNRLRQKNKEWENMQKRKTTTTRNLIMHCYAVHWCYYP